MASAELITRGVSARSYGDVGSRVLLVKLGGLTLESDVRVSRDFVPMVGTRVVSVSKAALDLPVYGASVWESLRAAGKKAHETDPQNVPEGVWLEFEKVLDSCTPRPAPQKA
jgi:hypothetical protein